MERVVGIGGLFFRAKNPEALNAWYAEHLGPSGGPNTEEVWQQEAGPTVWSAFDEATEYFGRREQSWMVNFRVSDLDAMLAQLRSAGAEVNDNIEEYDYGRFGWVTDPEGNRFELWEQRTGPQPD